jgi:hypothetical protein
MIVQADGPLGTAAAVIATLAGAVAGMGVGDIGRTVPMSVPGSGPSRMPPNPSSTGPKLSDVVDAGKKASGSPTQRADAMQPVLDQIKQARQGQGWDFARFDHAHGSGFFGQQGEAIVVGPTASFIAGESRGRRSSTSVRARSLPRGYRA